MDELAFPQFDAPHPLDDGRAWTARLESFDQRNDNVYYTICIVENGQVASTFIGRVSYVGDTQDEAEIRASFELFLQQIAASGTSNTDYTGSPLAAQTGDLAAQASDLPVAELTNASLDARIAACNTIADAVERGTPLDAAAEPTVALLGDPDRTVKQLAAFILQTDVERDPGGRGAAALRAALASEAEAVRKEAATLLAGCLARQEDGAAVAALIGNLDPQVKRGAITALANGALPRAQQDVVVAALTTVLVDADLAVRKEAIWALYLLASEGAAIEVAVPALDRAVDEQATQGNAAIALSLAWNATNDARANELATSASGVVQLGAAWGAADVRLRRGDLAAIKAMFTDENVNIRRGLGAFLHDAKRRGRDISLAGQAFTELERDHPDDALLHARIYAVREIVERGPDA